MEAEDPGNIEIADGVYARAGRLALDTRMTDDRAAQMLEALQRVSSG